jgi:ribosomal protein S4
MISNGFIKVNGVVLPYPSYGVNVQRQQFVDSARNANGQVIAQRVNRRIVKIDGLEWKHLTALEWHNILVEVEKFTGTLEYWDSLSMSYKTIQVYWGDASEEIFKIDPSSGEILEYINCKCNLIDMGY